MPNHRKAGCIGMNRYYLLLEPCSNGDALTEIQAIGTLLAGLLSMEDNYIQFGQHSPLMRRREHPAD